MSRFIVSFHLRWLGTFLKQVFRWFACSDVLITANHNAKQTSDSDLAPLLRVVIKLAVFLMHKIAMQFKTEVVLKSKITENWAFFYALHQR